MATKKSTVSTVAQIVRNPLAVAPKGTETSGDRRQSAAEVALTVLESVTRPFPDLAKRAEKAHIDVQVELGMGREKQAIQMAWEAVRFFNELAGPRYLESAERLYNIAAAEDPQFVEVVTDQQFNLAMAQAAAQENDWKKVIACSRKAYMALRKALNTPEAEEYFQAKETRLRAQLEEQRRAKKSRHDDNKARRAEENRQRARTAGNGRKG